MTDAPFNGFPNSGLGTALPNLFFSKLMPEITDAAELVVSAYVFFAAGRTKRQPRFVTRRELEADGGLVRALANLCGGHDGEALARGLELAARRGTFVRVIMLRSGLDEELYTVNTPANRRALERFAESEGWRIEEPLPPAVGEAAPDIFTLYEENIGAITPLIAEDLKEAEERYPAEWIRAAVREAVVHNARSWSYVAPILERWEKEGPSYEKPGRDPEADWLARRYREGKRSRA